MRVLVTGGNGQLGSALVGLLSARTTDVALGIDLPDIDITAPGSVSEVFAQFAPDVVINCAAWTAVDAAEAHEADALKVNGDGPRVLAEACKAAGAWLVQISTDYVFAGDANTPYAENARPDPKTAYGRTKLAGEIAVQDVLPGAHYLVRTAWLYGLQGNNFVKTMLELESVRDNVSVVDDQRGQPTYAGDLAEQILLLLDARPPAGIFHATNSGATTWFELTRAIFVNIGADPQRVLATDSASFVRPAPRPAYSVLGQDKWQSVGLTPMREWRAALTAAFADGITAP
ncbi:MAG: dTDP-4-dehydrorhamnose reductase [Actinobacteria bacterium]|nr:dTDP-4-dehydrorhamnose reductase [Actinomycetota bacterium]